MVVSNVFDNGKIGVTCRIQADIDSARWKRLVPLYISGFHFEPIDLLKSLLAEIVLSQAAYDYPSVSQRRYPVRKVERSSPKHRARGQQIPESFSKGDNGIGHLNLTNTESKHYITTNGTITLCSTE